MSYAYINRDYMKNKPNIWLCLPAPRRTKMRKLTEIYNVNIKFVLGRVHELSFDITSKVERNHELVKNPLIEMFNGYYQVYVEWNGIKEYFVYTKGNRKLDNSGKTLTYKLYSSSYMLSKKFIPIYEETSKPLRFHAEHFVENTNWTIGYIDPRLRPETSINAPYRSIEVTNSNGLNCLYDLAEKYDSIIIFNTVNQTVNFHKPDSVGLDKAFTFKDGIFIESLGYEIDFDKIVTRLHVYGSDGLEFRSKSPTGVNYIEDLTWFMYPFEQDSSGNVIKSSKWMTDDLCKAYLKYQEKLRTHTPTFETLATQKTSQEDLLTQLLSELSALEMELNQIENELWVINKTYKEEAPSRADWQDVTSRKYAKLREIRLKKYEILDEEAILYTIEDQIEALRIELSVENNFTTDLIKEMENFIHASYYTNDSVTDVDDLVKDGAIAFSQVNQPPITLNLDIVNFLNDIQYEKIYDRIDLGDTVRVKSEDLGVYISVKIIEIAYNLESDKITLTISNEKDLRDDMDKLVDKIYSSANTSSVVDVKKTYWEKGGEANSKVDDILNNAWDAAKNAVQGGYENTTILDKNGLRSTESGDSDTFLFINNGVFGITKDNLDTIEVAIDKTGVYANRLVGDMILGNNLHLTSENGILEADGETITIRDDRGDIRVELGKYTDGGIEKYGLKVTGGAIKIQTDTRNDRGTVIDENGIRVYDSTGNIVFDTKDGDNVIVPNVVADGSITRAKLSAEVNDLLDEINSGGGGSLSDGGTFREVRLVTSKFENCTVLNTLLFTDASQGTQGQIDHNNGDMSFETSNKRFKFYGDVHLMGSGVRLYIDGREFK